MAKQKKAQEVSAVRQAKHGWIITLLFTVLSVLWISPIFMVLLNSFKRKAYIFKHPFGISTVSITEGFEAFKDGMSRLFCSTLNYKNGLRMTHFWDCFGNSLFITVGSVVLIVLCCSMCAWYIVRVKTKVVLAAFKFSYMQNHLLFLHFLNGYSFPDGNVYIIKICKYASFIKSTRYHHCIPWLWSRTCCVYVYRICKEYLIRDRRGSYD